MDEIKLAELLRAFAFHSTHGENDAVAEASQLLNESMHAGDRYANVIGFDAAGVMTTNQGFVVHAADGSEFQVTVLRTR